MKFQVKNGSVECIRTSANNQQSVIVRFDENLKVAAPHVMSKLSNHELLKLEEWLAERELIKDAPTENNLLCLLPSLMDEAIIALDNTNSINQESYSLLVAATQRLNEKLLNVEDIVINKSSKLTAINRTEANKERIKQVKRDLL